LKDVPSILIDPIAIDRRNLEVVINDGWATREAVFQNAAPQTAGGQGPNRQGGAANAAGAQRAEAR
jgi:hypothetical protein